MARLATLVILVIFAAACAAPCPEVKTEPEAPAVSVLVPTPAPAPPVVTAFPPLPTLSPLETPEPEATPEPTATLAPPPTPELESIALQMPVIAELRTDIPKYDRRDWAHWTDVDRDCQDARQEVLIEESRVPVTYVDDKECRVVTGEWLAPYTGTVVTRGRDLDVDHLVPLANAHASGAWSWDKVRKALYANELSYPPHLIAVTAKANRSKGAKGPDKWIPPDEEYYCEYAVAWTTVKVTWGLTMTDREFRVVKQMLTTCDQEVILYER